MTDSGIRVAAGGITAATKVIAANDAVDTTRADYASDGIDDEADFQQFITDVGATGGELDVSEGTFIWGTATLTLASKLVFRGRGKNVTTLKMTNAAIFNMLTVDTKSDILFQDMTFDGNATGAAIGSILYAKDVTRLRFERCCFKDVGSLDPWKPMCNFWNGPSPNLEFIDCDFDTAGDVALDLDGAGALEYLKIMGCFFKDIAGRSIKAFTVNLPDAKICFNVVEGGGTNNVPALDIALDHNTVVKGNIVKTPGAEGIYIRGATVDGIFEGNGVYFSGSDGIKLGGNHYTVRGNTVNGVQSNIHAGMVIMASRTHLVLSENMVSGCQGVGIEVEANCAFLDLSNNLLYNNGQQANNTYSDILLKNPVTDSKICGNTIIAVAANKTKYGIEEEAGGNRNTVKENMISGPIQSMLVSGAANAYDRHERSVALDLSGVAADVEVFHAIAKGFLVGYTILYTEASSADAGVDIRVGRYQDGVALDDDYFDVSVSEVSQNLGYSKHFATADLINKSIAAGDTITVGTAGAKVGAGEVMLILQIVEQVD